MKRIKLIMKESVVTRAKGEELINEEEYVKLNDGRNADVDYIIQDVTDLVEISDEDTESPSVEGLLSLVNESLNEKYGSAWGMLKAKSISTKKEGYEYAIVDIVTPSILKEAQNKKIKDSMVSRTVILENIENSSKVNFKINSLAGTTRFSQKTNNPVQVFSRWLESEYLFEEMAEDFQKKLDAREVSLKDSTEEFLNTHPDIRVRVATIKSQYNELKKSDEFDISVETAFKDLAYGLMAEFPFNISVKSDEDNKAEQSFDTVDELVKMVFGAEFVRENEEPKKAMKESYETFQIGEIEGTFNTETLEVLYSINSEDVKDKKLNLSKVPTVETPYNTETIIKDYIETNFGVVPSEVEDGEPAEQEKSEEEPIEKEKEPIIDREPIEDLDVDDGMTDEEPQEMEEADLPDEPSESEVEREPKKSIDTKEKEVQAETGEAEFYKVKQNEPISYDMLEAKKGTAQRSSYIVVEEKTISASEMEDYLADMSKTMSFLSSVKPTDRKNYPFNVLKLSAEGYDPILIDPVGYDYGRYVGIEGSSAKINTEKGDKYGRGNESSN